MNAKKVLPLVAAVVLGLVAARMVVQVARSKGVGPVANANPLPMVVVAKTNVNAGQELREEDLAIGQIATQPAPGTTFTAPAELVGRVAAVPLVMGQPVMVTLLAPKGAAPGLSTLIPPGMRALTIEINETSGVAGYLTQSCHVDIIQTLHDDRTGEQKSRAIAQNVTVLAIGQRHNPADDAVQQVRSVTLLLTPRQSEQIELATMNGRPRLVLRNFQDDKIDESTGVTVAELLGHNPADGATTVGLPATRPAPVVAAVDPFAGPTTKPSAPEWAIRTIVAGEASVVKVKLPPQPDAGAVAHTEFDTINK